MRFLGCYGPLTTREKGAAIATLGGAALGGIFGSATGNAGAGAGIGSSNRQKQNMNAREQSWRD